MSVSRNLGRAFGGYYAPKGYRPRGDEHLISRGALLSRMGRSAPEGWKPRKAPDPEPAPPLTSFPPRPALPPGMAEPHHPGMPQGFPGMGWGVGGTPPAWGGGRPRDGMPDTSVGGPSIPGGEKPTPIGGQPGIMPFPGSGFGGGYGMNPYAMNLLGSHFGSMGINPFGFGGQNMFGQGGGPQLQAGGPGGIPGQGQPPGQQPMGGYGGGKA